MSLKRQPYSLKDENYGPKELHITKGPFTVKTASGLEVRIDAFNNVTIVGQNSLKFKCEGDMEFEADNITMKSKETYRIEGGKHLVQKAKRIDLNPNEKENNA